MSLVTTVTDFLASAPELDLSSYDNTTVSGILNRSQKRAEGYLDYSLYQEDTTEKIDAIINANGDLVIYPTKLPINSLESLKIVKGSFELTINTDSPAIDIPNKHDAIYVNGSELSYTGDIYIDFRNLRQFTVFADITYNAGYSVETLPADIQYAIFLYARDELSRKYNTTGAKSISQGAVTISYQQRDGKSELVQDAESALSTYRRRTGW